MSHDRPSPEPAEQIQNAERAQDPVEREPDPATRAAAERSRAGVHDSVSQGSDAASPNAPREDR